jgi:hypothetical protein
VQQGGEGVKKAVAITVIVVLQLVAACAPAAPTPTRTPEPTATPVEVRATKPEHLAGIWFDGASYQRYEADGSLTIAESIENLDSDYIMTGRFWFEDGKYYEEPPICLGVFAYEAYLRIEEGRAVRIRMTVIDVPDPPCPDLTLGTQRKLVRVDQED